LHLLANENPATIQRRLAVAAKTLGITLSMKRSGEDIYFWIEPQEEAKPRLKAQAAEEASNRPKPWPS
jgi:hypothetical protein